METELCALAPADWPVRSVEEVCTRVTSGGTPSRREPSYYIGGSYPWVKTQELQDKWLDDTEEHITDEAVARSSAKVLPKHTVLVAMYGATVGQLGLLRRPMTCNQACSALVVDPSEAAYRYLFFQLLHARTQLKSLATGAAQQNLSGVLIKSLRFPFPPLPEQRAIAHILGTLDDKIELNRLMNEALETIARAIFKSWFVDFDPVRAKAEGRDTGLPRHLSDLFPDSFEESELGEIPKGWFVVNLGDVIELAYGRALKDENRRPGRIPVFGSNGQIGWHHERLANGPGIIVGRKGNPGIVTWAPADFFAIDTTFLRGPENGGQWPSFPLLRSSRSRPCFAGCRLGSSRSQSESGLHEQTASSTICGSGSLRRPHTASFRTRPQCRRRIPHARRPARHAAAQAHLRQLRMKDERGVSARGEVTS